MAFRGDDTLQVAARRRAELREVRARDVVAEVGRSRLRERHRAAAASVERRTGHVDLRDRQHRVAQRQVHAAAVDLVAAHLGPAGNERPLDVVVGERRRFREELLGRHRDFSCAGQGGRESRIGERDRRIDPLEPAVVRRAQRTAIDRDRDVCVGKHSVEHVGARDAAAAGERQPRRARARAVHVKAPRHYSRVSRIAEPRDVEPGAEAPEIDPADVAFARVAERLLQRVDRSDGARADGGAEKLRRREGGAADDVRLAESSVDLVVERQAALDARDRKLRRHVPQIDCRRRALKAVRKRLVEADGAVVRRDGGAVRDRVGRSDQHGRGRNLPVRAQVVRRVVHVHRVPAVERVDAARKMASELEGEIERHVARDVRRPFGSVQPAREVQTIDVHCAGAVPAGHRCVEHEMTADAAAGAG